MRHLFVGVIELRSKLKRKLRIIYISQKGKGVGARVSACGLHFGMCGFLVSAKWRSGVTVLLCFCRSASAEDGQASGNGESSGKWTRAADGKPESEPCQRGSVHLDRRAPVCVLTATLARYHARNVITVWNDRQTSVSAFIHLPPGDTWDQPYYTVIFRGFSVCSFV